MVSGWARGSRVSTMKQEISVSHLENRKIYRTCEKPYMIILIDSQKQRADSKLATPRFQARTVALSADVFVSLRSVLPPAIPGREEG